jgi:hypothetical protein
VGDDMAYAIAFGAILCRIHDGAVAEPASVAGDRGGQCVPITGLDERVRSLTFLDGWESCAKFAVQRLAVLASSSTLLPACATLL